MIIHRIVLLFAVLIPLSIDTFAVSAALGAAGLEKKQQLKTSLTLAGFEAGMPVIGVLIGHSINGFLGDTTGYLAGIVIAAAGFFMLRPSSEDQQETELKLIENAKGWKIIALGFAISVDGLAVGLGLGLLHISLLSVVIGMAVVAFLASTIGLEAGARLGKHLRNQAEMFAGIILIAVGLIMVTIKVIGH